MPTKFKYTLLLSIIVCTTLHAQDKNKHTSLKLDVLNFRNQATRLKEFKTEQKNTVELGVTYGGPVKIVVEIDADTTAEEEETTDPADNILIGYIKEQTPTESIIAYELHFDRTTKKIFEIIHPTEPADKKEDDK